MDVSRQEDIEALAAKLKGMPIDLLINNAGVYSGTPTAQNFGTFDFALFDTIMAVNVRGPLMVTQAFVNNLKAGQQKKIVNISSTVGSLTDPFPGGGVLFYRTSKAALNKEMQVLADVLKPAGLSVVMIHPGLVRTERLESLAPQVATNKDYMDPPQAVGQMIPTIEKLTLADSGHFMRYDGAPLAW
jgi:NAD(P)-dependent dehydrogenase (short-subunit alcohol dehydrogenase family)